MEGSGQPIKGTLHPLGEVVARLAPVVFIVAWIAARVTGPVKRLEAYQRGTVVPAFERKMQALAACEEVVMLVSLNFHIRLLMEADEILCVASRL